MKNTERPTYLPSHLPQKVRVDEDLANSFLNNCQFDAQVLPRFVSFHHFLISRYATGIIRDYPGLSQYTGHEITEPEACRAHWVVEKRTWGAPSHPSSLPRPIRRIKSIFSSIQTAIIHLTSPPPMPAKCDTPNPHPSWKWAASTNGGNRSKNPSPIA